MGYADSIVNAAEDSAIFFGKEGFWEEIVSDKFNKSS